MKRSVVHDVLQSVLSLQSLAGEQVIAIGLGQIIIKIVVPLFNEKVDAADAHADR